jgi:molybdopterin-dependent oxidoreductase alpha subunit
MSDNAVLPIPAPPADLAGPPLRGRAAHSGLVPFGLGRTKPHHYVEMAQVAWENRDRLGYALSILRHGVCDGCSLGPRGLRDDVIPGVHLCMSRLKLLRNNTMPAFHEDAVADISALRRMDNRTLRGLGRLPYPFLYRRGERGFRRLSWDEALALAGERLRATPGRRQGWFATSKGITNEAYYAFTKAARLLGSNNVDFCARLCHQASVAGLSRSIGIGAPTCSLSDFIGSDLLLLWGTNLANNQPVAVKYLHHAKKAGTRVVVVNAVREKGLDDYWIPSIPESALFGSRIADDFVRVRVGGDIALLNAIQKLLIAWGAVDRSFVDAHTAGWDAFVAELDRQDLDGLIQQSGASREDVTRLAEMVARARSMVTVWSMGITQHRFGTENVQALANLHLLRGAVGRQKCGLMPIRGHSGVQGGGECGVSPEKLPGGVPCDEGGAARFSELWGHEVPSWPGLSTGPMLEASYRGAIDVLYCLGGNFLSTMPDPRWVSEALARVPLRIHQDVHVNESTVLEPGEAVLLLPAQTRYEQRGGGTSTSTERRIRFSPEIPGHPQVGEARPDYEIPALVARSARPELAGAFDWADSAAIRAEMGRTMPVYKGIETLSKEGDWLQWGGPLLCAGGEFPNLPDRRARLTPLRPPPLELPEGRFILTTRRGKQFNSMVFEDRDAIQGGERRDVVWLGTEDAARLGVSAGDRVRLSNDLGNLDCTARIVDIAPGCVQAYWPEANVLIPPRWDPTSLEPDYNAVVEMRRLP